MDGLQYQYNLTPAPDVCDASTDQLRIKEDIESVKLQRRYDLIRAISIGLLTSLMYVESLVQIISPGPLYLLIATLLGVIAIVTTSNRLDRIDQPSNNKLNVGVKKSFAKMFKTIWPAALVMIVFGILGYRSTAVPAAFPLVLTVINLFFVIADNDRVKRLQLRLNDRRAVS